MKKRYLALALIVFIAAWSGLLYVYGADRIVELLGDRNGYIVMFLVSLLGGMSSIGGPSYVATLITLAAGGLNPLFLALAAGAGTTIGDSVYFYIAKHGLRAYAREGRIAHYVERATAWLDRKPAWMTYVGVYLCLGFTPMPNDIITIALGLANRPYLPTITATALGNMTLTYLVAKFGTALPFI